MSAADAVVDAHDVFSPANRRRFTVWSWQPATDVPSPLLVLLHGVGDSGGHGWWLRARVHEQVAAMFGSGELRRPPVVIMPTDTGAEYGSAYADWPDGTTLAETFVAEELLRWARHTFSLTNEVWLTGLSMGGYGALLLSLRHPGLVTSATSMSGFFRPERLFSYGADLRARIWGAAQQQAEHDVTQLFRSLDGRHEPRIAFDCGHADHNLGDNRELHAQLGNAGIRHGYAEHEGGHDWDYWRSHVADHIRFHAGLPGPLGRLEH